MRDHDQTDPRYAQTIVGYDLQNPDAYLWRKQLGALGEVPATLQQCMAQGMVLDLETMQCAPPILPGAPMPGAPMPGAPQLPAGALVVTEQQCAARETQAREAGRAEEAGKVWKAAAVSAAVSLTIGYLFAKVLR